MADTAQQPQQQAGDRGARKVRVGEVISDKMDKTVVVRVDRRLIHPQYGKVITRSKKFYVHDEKGEAGVGDQVEIVETRPLSKLKRWRLVKVLKKAEQIDKIADGLERPGAPAATTAAASA
jgi:small subunit ribosomal protein S17